jgi:RNA polymerase sigma factor (sigma-70 family)
MQRSAHDSIPRMTRAIASGDTEAFARFYEQWFDWMYGQASAAGGRDEAFCLDVVQDAMLKVMRSIKPIPDEPRLKGWLRVTVQRCAYDRLRAERRRAHREEYAAAPERAGAAEPDLDEQIAWLRDELQQLSREDLHLLTMRHRFGWTLRQIGLRLGLRTGAVDRRLTKTVTTLRDSAEGAVNDSRT